MNFNLLRGLPAILAFAGLISISGKAQSQGLGVTDAKPTTQITLTPRAAYYFDDFSTSGFYVLPSGDGGQNESVEFPRGPLRAPMFGGNVSIKPASAPRLTLTLGALYGKKKGISVDGIIIDPRAGATNPDGTPKAGTNFSRQLTDLNYSRLDVEATAQYRLNDFIALIGGIRYERGRVNFRACFENYDSNDGGKLRANPTLTFAQASSVCREILASGVKGAQFGGTLNQISTATGRTVLPSVTAGRDAQTNIFFTAPDTGKDGYDIITGRLGAVVAVPLSESGRASVFAHGFIVGGNRHVTGDNERRFDNAIVAGPDLTIGMAYAITSHVSLDLRYRASYLFPLSGPRNTYDPRASHGAILSLGYRL